MTDNLITFAVQRGGKMGKAMNYFEKQFLRVISSFFEVFSAPIK